MKTTIFPISLLAAIGCQFAPALAGDVLSWRLDGNGLFPAASAVTDWAAASAIAWETALPARSNGCPILVGGKLFFTAEPETLVCADAKSGRILWQTSNEYADLVDLTPEQAKELEEAQAFA